MNNTDVNNTQKTQSMDLLPDYEMNDPEINDPEITGFEIAIIGMAGQFAGAGDIDEFWQNIAAGVESIRPLSDEELDAAGITMEARSRADFIRNASVLDYPEDFDAEFFGYSPREAQAMDPQQRLFLETSWLALENAGYAPEKYPGAIGVFASTSSSSYLFHYLLNHSAMMQEVMSDIMLLGNNRDLLSTRVSYKFNLRGPSFIIGSACSSSMVALHYACQSLLAGECDMALSGGVHIGFPSHSGYHFEGSGILSHDGHCRTFDAEASGTLSGDGVGVVILKRLQDALDSRDHIYAVIKGSAINNDGAEKIGFTAPSVTGQASVIQRALLAAEVPANSISYVEAHGTATHLGDPMEMQALIKAYGQDAPDVQQGGVQIPCAVASVKANIGHTDSAAGVTGVMKVAQMLTHRYLPPAVNFSRLNPEINLTGSRFYIPTEGKAWQGQGILRAGVSSFGMGGTNAHMILEEAPPIPPSGPAYPQQLLCFSAKTPAALRGNLKKFRDWLEKFPEQPLADIAYTLHVGRNEMDYRYSLVCHDHANAITVLDNCLSRTSQGQENIAGAFASSSAATLSSALVFMFSGQGSQYAGMMRGYYEQESRFRAVVDQCATILRPLLGRDIRPLIFDSAASNKAPANASANMPANTPALYETRYTQPALFVVEYALSQLLMEWGIRPSACIGHSIGEYVAACLAGVFTLEDALTIVTKRAELMNRMPGGKMLAVGLDRKTLQGYLHEGVTLAACNAPEFCVVSGETGAILALEAALEAEGVETRALHTSHAFHSAMMEGCLEPFRRVFDGITLSPPDLPFISCITGEWISREQATSPDYWVRQLREPVEFSQGIACLLSHKTPVLLEVGPGSSLTGLARMQVAGSAFPPVFSSTRDIKQDIPDRQHLLNALGQLWRQGVSVNWSALYQTQARCRLPLPGYTFQHQRYSLDTLVSQAPDSQSRCNLSAPKASAPKAGRLPPEQWGHQIRWKQMLAPTVDNSELNGQVFLIFMDRLGVGKQLTSQLEKQGGKVWQVVQGGRFSANAALCRVTINPQQGEDYQALATLLHSQHVKVSHIIHAWSITRSFSISLQTAFTNYESLLHIARQFAAGNPHDTVLKINILSNRLHAISDHDRNDPAKALLIGPSRVIPKEFEQVQCKSIDISLSDNRWSLPLFNPVSSRTLSALLAEIIGHSDSYSGNNSGNNSDGKRSDNIVAIRGRNRYLPLLETAELPVAASPSFRRGGNYLITGGFGGIGATIATYLASRYQPHLIFISRSELPPKNEWSDWLDSHDTNNKRSQNIRLLQQLQQMGASVSVISADVADAGRIGKALTDITLQYGQIHGIFHSAGIADAGLIQNRKLEDSLQVFRSKVVGTQVLNHCLRHHSLDFFVLCSSLASTVGAVGQVAYCAANAYEDAFALLHHQHRPANRRQTRYLAIGWDAWREVGMAVDSLSRWYQDEEQDTISHGILPEEGCQLLERLLAHDDSVYAISTQGLPLPDSGHESGESDSADHALNADKPSFNSKTGSKTSPKTPEQKLYPRPVLSVDYQPPRNPTEAIIADIWHEKMGIGPLGVFDDFFELNGHSLMAVQIIARIKQRLQVIFPVGFIYEHPSIAQLAEQVDLSHKQQANSAAESRKGDQ
ncbi:type I polyketide synthase [Xenorhabdus szentirmaii]|uniref:type I polyketide synthase n=1 Tax=Xenorhabdus szentirmaii TaxID=290112 RepID=UPI002B404C95|nr:SDR family NAD(P)-dependent oxidoreductase [Xenorhabdus sp. 38]